MSPPKKGILGIALDAKEPDDDDEGKDEELENGPDFDAIADDAFDALKEGDKKGFRAALRAAVESCMTGYEE